MIHGKEIAVAVVVVSLVIGFALNAGQVSQMKQQLDGMKSELEGVERNRSSLENEFRKYKETQEVLNKSFHERILAEQKRINDFDDAILDIKVSRIGNVDQVAETLESLTRLHGTMAIVNNSLHTCSEAFKRTDRSMMATIDAMEELIGDKSQSRITSESMVKAREALEKADKMIREPLPEAEK